MGRDEGAFQAFSHTATSPYRVCHEFNHLKLFESYSLMIYGYAMVWNVSKYSYLAK